MNEMLASQPEIYSKVIKRSFQLYKKSLTHIFLLTLIFSAVTFMPEFLSVLVGQDLLDIIPTSHANKLWLLLINLVSLFFFIAILWRMRCVMHNRHEPLLEDFSKGVKKVIPVFIAAVIQFSVLFLIDSIFEGLDLMLIQEDYLASSNLLGSSTAFGVLFIEILLAAYIYMYFYFYTPIIAIENKSVFSSIEKSIMLVWRNWWRTFAVQITPWLVYLLVLMMITRVFAINVFINYSPEGPQNWIGIIPHLIIFALFTPWFAATMLVQLRDLELRKHMLRT